MNDRWQARKEGDKQMRAGLIPSRMLQEKRIAYERAHSANNNADQQGIIRFDSMVFGQEWSIDG